MKNKLCKFDHVEGANAYAPPSSMFFNKEVLAYAASKSRSLAELVSFYTPSQSGGISAVAKKYLAAYSIDVSHFTKRKPTPLRHIENPFTENSPVSGQFIRQKILSEGLLPYACKCGLGPVWRSRPLTLQLDHVNGNRRDHRLSNLVFLCPNCHSITSTFSGANSRKNSKVPTKDDIDRMFLERTVFESSHIHSAISLNVDKAMESGGRRIIDRCVIQVVSERYGRDFFERWILANKRMDALSKEINVPLSAIKKILTAQGLSYPARPAALQLKTATITKEAMEAMFEKGMTLGQIALLYGCTDVAIRKKAIKLNAYSSPHKHKRPRHPLGNARSQ